MQQQLLSKLTQSLKSLEILDEQQLRPGKTLTARVASITPVNPELRARLMQLLNNSELSLQKTITEQPRDATGKTHTNAASQQTGQPVQNRNTAHPTENKLTQLLNQQQLYVVQLKVLGKLLTTLTNTTLSPHSSTTVQVREDGQLQLLTPQKSAISTHQGTGQPVTKNVSTATSAILSPQNTGQQTKPVAQHATQTISEGLKTYLPNQQPLSHSIRELQHFTQHLNQQGVSKQNPDLAQLLTRLSNIVAKAPALEQLVQVTGLQHTIKNSGAFLESHLRQLVRNSTTNPVNSSRTVNSAAANTPHINTSMGRTTAGAEVSENDIKYNDVKAELLRAHSDIQRLITTPSAARISSVDKMLQNLFSFLPGGKTPTPKLPTPHINSQLAQNIQPSILSALARITSLQLRHLIQNQQDGNLSGLGGFLELPVRVGEQVYPLTLNIQERIHEEKEEDEQENTKADETRGRKIKKRWHVFMEFDLDELGTFAGDIRVEDEHVSTQLWVQKTVLWEASRQHLSMLKNELENSGITVDNISCHQGKAPEKSMRVQQSLVDVRT